MGGWAIMPDFAKTVRRGAGAVERGGLENRCTRERTEGSNPSLSAISCAQAPVPGAFCFPSPEVHDDLAHSLYLPGDPRQLSRQGARAFQGFEVFGGEVQFQVDSAVQVVQHHVVQR